MKPLISIIFIYYNTPKEIKVCLDGLRQATSDLSYEVIIIDNASPKPLPEEVVKNKQITVINNTENIGFGKACNQAATLTKGTFLLFLNPDTILEKNSIKKMVERMTKQRDIGILGPQMRDTSGKVLPTISGDPTLPRALFAFSFLNKLLKGNKFSESYWLYKKDRTREQIVDVVGGACILIRHDTFEKVKGFDTRFFMYFEEADLCRKVRLLGYRVLYFPNAQIIHLVGRSSTNKKWIKTQFEKSRFLYFKKYYGIILATLGEFFLRYGKPVNLSVIAIFSLSLFLNLYKINTLMMFFGDFGRDYLAARDFILTNHVPLVGIPSSVKWLHQGPISIWMIALALKLGNFNPIAPAILYGIIGAGTTVFVYKLGSSFFNKQVGLLASIFFATSPLALVNTRMPYHTSLIPFFSCLFFLMLWQVLNDKRKYLFWLFFAYGLLLQVELSNGVLVFVLLLFLFLKRPKVFKKDILVSFAGSIFGLLPFLLYDTTHHFVQTLGFPLWVINRIRLFFGLTNAHNGTTAKVPGALKFIANELTSTVFPESYIITGIIFLLVGFVIFKQRKNLRENTGLLLASLWFVIPLIGYTVHAAPSTAYFPVLFPAVSLLIGYTWYILHKRNKIFIVLFFLIIGGNVFSVLYNDYYLTTRTAYHSIPPASYNIGTTWTIYEDLAKVIALDAKGKPLSITGAETHVQTDFDNYRYLAIYHQANLSEKTNLMYVIYQSKKRGKNSHTIFMSQFGSIERYEKK